MATAHIESKKEEIAKTVLMPGDPLRAKYIAEKFLSDVKVVNTVRNMTAYTGTYKGKEITVFPSGMGIPSAGIYAYELFEFYDVEEIIRIGTAGSNSPEVKILDVVLASSAYSLSTFALQFDGDLEKEFEANKELTDKLALSARNNNIDIHVGEIITSEVFDVYVDFEKYIKLYPEDKHFLASEMEAYVLFYLANKLNKKAASLVTVVDSKYDKTVVSSLDRQTSLDDMIKISLEAVL